MLWSYAHNKCSGGDPSSDHGFCGRRGLEMERRLGRHALLRSACARGRACRPEGADLQSTQRRCDSQCAEFKSAGCVSSCLSLPRNLETCCSGNHSEQRRAGFGTYESRSATGSGRRSRSVSRRTESERLARSPGLRAAQCCSRNPHAYSRRLQRSWTESYRKFNDHIQRTAGFCKPTACRTCYPTEAIASGFSKYFDSCSMGAISAPSFVRLHQATRPRVNR